MALAETLKQQQQQQQPVHHSLVWQVQYQTLLWLTTPDHAAQDALVEHTVSVPVYQRNQANLGLPVSL